ncbi:class I SAM-dependent methyltransferase [Halofilum ochraceum]|uniref:class I SAM-dependent methyltransferase n=1 Tax=Halofilum ochraceum TaxID=1611323 RepID=UPI001FE15700|nr:class I SAM-dependent methyltransferase [Halofilum ochraceum]
MGSPSEKRRSTDALYPHRAMIVCAAGGRRTEADALAQGLGVPLVGELPDEPGSLALVLTDERLQVQLTGPGAPGPVYAEFVTGATARRGREAARADEGLLRAAGARHGQTPDVIDATGGLGRDAWLLAALGCRVTLVERHPAVAALLADGLKRARDDETAAEIAARIELIEAEAVAVLGERTADTVIVDPMHPPRRKSAAVRKEMQVFRALVGADGDSDRLLPAAIAAARRRVAVKRPRGARPLPGPAPSGSIDGRSTRFDIYAGGAREA